MKITKSKRNTGAGIIDALPNRLEELTSKVVLGYIKNHPIYKPYKDDLIQEILLRILEMRDELATKDDTYIKSVIRYQLYAHLRDINKLDSSSRVALIGGFQEKGEKDDHSKSALNSLTDNQPTPAEELIYKDLLKQARKVLAGESEQVLNLLAHVRRGLSINDAAEKCQVPRSSAYLILRRLRDDIKRQLLD